jgi:hypothetical protein
MDFLSHDRNIYDIHFGNYVSEGVWEVEEAVSVLHGFLLAVLYPRILLSVVHIFLIIGRNANIYGNGSLVVGFLICPVPN